MVVAMGSEKVLGSHANGWGGRRGAVAVTR